MSCVYTYHLLIYFHIIRHLQVEIYSLNTQLNGASRIRVTLGQVQLVAVPSGPANIHCLRSMHEMELVLELIFPLELGDNLT